MLSPRIGYSEPEKGDRYKDEGDGVETTGGWPPWDPSATPAPYLDDVFHPVPVPLRTLHAWRWHRAVGNDKGRIGTKVRRSVCAATTLTYARI